MNTEITSNPVNRRPAGFGAADQAQKKVPTLTKALVAAVALSGLVPAAYLGHVAAKGLAESARRRRAVLRHRSRWNSRFCPRRRWQPWPSHSSPSGPEGGRLPAVLASLASWSQPLDVHQCGGGLGGTDGVWNHRCGACPDGCFREALRRQVTRRFRLPRIGQLSISGRTGQSRSLGWLCRSQEDDTMKTRMLVLTVLFLLASLAMTGCSALGFAPNLPRRLPSRLIRPTSRTRR